MKEEKERRKERRRKRSEKGKKRREKKRKKESRKYFLTVDLIVLYLKKGKNELLYIELSKVSLNHVIIAINFCGGKRHSSTLFLFASSGVVIRSQ